MEYGSSPLRMCVVHVCVLMPVAHLFMYVLYIGMHT